MNGLDLSFIHQWVENRVHNKGTVLSTYLTLVYTPGKGFRKPTKGENKGFERLDGQSLVNSGVTELELSVNVLMEDRMVQTLHCTVLLDRLLKK